MKQNLSLFSALVLVLAFQHSAGECQEDNSDDAIRVPLPLLVKKFISIDKATAFSIGKDSKVLAAFSKKGKLRVATIQGNRKGKIFKTDLELDHSPRLLISDLDGDSIPEILVCSEKLRIFRMLEDGLSLAWTSNESFNPRPAPRLGLADFNGDRRSDIVVLNYQKEKVSDKESVYVYSSQSDESFFRMSGSITLTDKHGYHSFSGLAIGDFSNDDTKDLVVGNDNGWMWLLRVEKGKPIVEKSWVVESGGAIGPGLSAGNMVAGGKQELLVGTNGGDIFVYGFDSGSSPSVVAAATAGRLAYGVQANDMDGDGLDEFLLARGSLGYARMTEKDVVAEIWKLDGDSLSMIWRTELTGFVTPRLALKDIDEDGQAELVTYSPFGEGKVVEAIKPMIDKAK